MSASGRRPSIELAYAENNTNVPTAFDIVSTAIPGCVISVPASPAIPVWLYWRVGFQITAAGAGGLYAVVYDITNAGHAFVDSTGTDVLAADNGAATVFPAPAQGMFRVGVLATARQYALEVVAARDAASALAAQARNAATNPRSWLAAKAG